MSSAGELGLGLICCMAVAFWMVIWIMHVCALANAKLKLNKRSYQSAASRRKRRNSPCPKLAGQCQQQSQLFNSTKAIHPHQHLVEAKTSPQQHSPANGLALQCKLESPQAQLPVLAGPQLNDSEDSTESATSGSSSSSLAKYAYINMPLPGVSIIKPLLGLDSSLRHNLETFFNMDYPYFEILFCVQDHNDPVIETVQQLIKCYANQVDAQLFVGGAQIGCVNPKINNMQPAYEASKYELVLVSDSAIAMQADTLLDMVSHMRDDVALVHQMPFVYDVPGRGFQSVMEKVYFGTAHARAYLTADLLNINCATGMSALMRKSLLDEVGGIKAFGQYLAEDFFFAKSFTERGWKLSISSQPALQNSPPSADALSQLNGRIERWIKLRLAMVPQWTLLEPFSECMLIGILGALALNNLWPSIDPLAVFVGHVCLWFLSDYKLLCTIQNGPLVFSKAEFVLAWLIRECTALLVFLRALARPAVTWRSRNFRLKWGGHAEEIL